MLAGGECKDDTFWVAKIIAGGVLGLGSVDGVGTWALFNRPTGVASGVAQPSPRGFTAKLPCPYHHQTQHNY